MGSFAAGAARAEDAYPLAWVRQLGTNTTDYSRSVAVDGSDNTYISGITYGSLGGPNVGKQDAFLAKYDATGALLWTRQLGTTGPDESNSVAIDLSGNVYISGRTLGSLGGLNAGSDDVFVAKYNNSGGLLWTRQLGTGGLDYSWSVAIDNSGSAYITGYTTGNLGGLNAGMADVFLAKYDSSGSLLWTRQLGTSSNDFGNAVAVDGLGNAYVSGITYGSLAGPNAGGSGDAFLTKYDSSGTLLWTRQFGTNNFDESNSVAIDYSGNVYISGRTAGSLGGPSAGGWDAFLAKYDCSGVFLWARQLGTNSDDYSSSVAIDGSGNAYISGPTDGSLGGLNMGGTDAFLAKYNSSGALLWTYQMIGTEDPFGEVSNATDGSGNIYITANTTASLGGQNAGGSDAFLAKFSAPVPEPGTVFMIASAALGAFGMLIRRRAAHK